MSRHPWLVSVFLVATMVLLVAPTASAQTYPPQTPTIGVSDSSLSQGGSTTVSGQNWLGDSTVTLALLKGGCSGSVAQSLGSASVNGDGEFSKAVTLDVSPGTYGIQAKGSNEAGEAATRCAAVQMLAAGETVATTGAHVLFGMMLVIGLAVIGVIALVAGRRRAEIGASE
ncbi:MAG: hypothetical protein AB1551_06000 [Actinomycetota bacterium]